LVHTNKTIGDFINAHYVSVKINGDSLEGKQLRDQYKYPGYPTTILMTANGEEIDRIVGFGGNKDEYFQVLKDYTEGRGTLGDYLNRLINEPGDFEANYAVLKKYEDRNDYPAMRQYAGTILKLDPENKQGKRYEMQYYIALGDFKTSGEVAALKKFIAGCSDEQWLQQAYNNIIRFYSKKQDQPNVLATYEAALEKLPQSADLMNGYAWYIFENKVSEKYARGIQAVRRAVEMEPEADHIWDTLGQLLYADGQVEEAIQVMLKAAEIDPKEESYRENIKKYQKH